MAESDPILEAYRKVVNDPFEFLKICFTKDEVDRKNPIKRFPYELAYLNFYVRLWQRRKKIAIHKSRRMKMSWTNIALVLWDAMFHKGTHQAMVSKKEADADALVKRAEFLYKNLDTSVIPRDLFPKAIGTFNQLNIPDMDSRIEGFPSGADQLRQYTLTRIVGDEMAFWDNAEEMYSASLPTLEGGGSFVGLSSPAPGFFKRLCDDKLDQDDMSTSEDLVIREKKILKPMQGLRVWDNPGNGFTVMELHYTADPAKRSKEWKANERRSMPRRKWEQEYELKWESWSGKAVYADYDDRLHAVDGHIDPVLGLPLLRGWDFGLTPAAVIAQVEGTRLSVLMEFTGYNEGIDTFSDKVISYCKAHFPYWADFKRDWIDWYDPAGNAKSQTNADMCSMILKRKGLRAVMGPVSFEERRASIEHFLTRRDKHGPCFQISRTYCPILVRGFKGGYRYPDEKNIAEIETNRIKPVKDEHSHPHDALQYLAGGILRGHNRNRIDIPMPAYGWTRGM